MLAAAIRSSFEHFIGLPSFPLAPLTVSIVRLRTGIDVGRIRPSDVIARISPRPLLHRGFTLPTPPGKPLDQQHFNANHTFGTGTKK